MLSYLPKIRGSYRENYDLSKVTWFGVGGCADVLFKPEDSDDLIHFLQNVPKEIDIITIGVGSNLLVRDGGINGVVIRLSKAFNQIDHYENILSVGAGTLDVNVSKYCADHGLSGLEFLSGIPGVIGAGIAMNAGAYGREISDALIRVDALDKNGNLIHLQKDDCGFKYRGNSLDGLIFIKAHFDVEPTDKISVEKRIKEICSQREATQPIRSKTGGSTFKNPQGYKAWELIDKAGCRGLSVGGAAMSNQHCNFLINLGSATSQDIESLGKEVQRRVFENSGIILEWEIKIIGKEL